MIKRLAVASILIVLVTYAVGIAAERIDVVYFYENGCPQCSRIDTFLERMQAEYGQLELDSYEVHEEETLDLLDRLAQEYGIVIEQVPILFIGDQVFQGAGRAAEYNIEETIRKAAKEGATSPLARLENSSTGSTDVGRKLTLPAVVLAAAVDAVNPCACAVLILLLGTLIAAGKRRRIVLAGISFTASVYISYLLMGIGLYSAIQAAHVQHVIFLVVACLAILVGLWNMKDYLWYGRWFTLEVPMSWRPALKRLTTSVTSAPGAFAIGFLVSLFLLPCTSGPYLVILGLLAKSATRNYAFALLLLYNFIFVLPFIVITFGIAFGLTTTARAERWRSERLEKLHLVTGVVMFLLGVVMIVSIKLGYM